MGRSLLSFASLAALAALLAGCGPPLAWQKPGTSLADADLDSRRCYSLARDQAFRESFFSPYPGYAWPGYGYPYYPYGPYGYRRGYQDSFMWRGQRESDLQDFCMRASGYSLQPIPQ
jgi:hypothetical protein